MKKILLLFMLALLASFGFAAVANYTFGYSTETYAPITGGTVLGTATVGGSGATSLDNVTYFNTPIPFNFGFNGRRYNQVGVNSNGYLIFGGTTAFAESNQIAASTAADGVVVAYGKDNQGIVVDGSLGEIRYETLDSYPNRIFVIQWKNFRDYSGTADLLNFQVRLYEATNEIKISYGSITVVSTETCQVGLRGTANTDFFNRTTTTSWASSTAGATNAATMAVSSSIYPANGSVYTFTPDAATAVPSVANIVSPANAATNVFASATLNWTDGGGWTNGFKLYFGTTTLDYVGDLGYVTSYDPPGDMAYTTAHQWKVVPYNSFGENTTGTTWTFTTSGAPLSGTKIIGLVPPYDYTTFSSAIAALNGAGVGTGGVTFEVQDGTYNENPPAITVTGTASNPIKFQAAPGANPVVTPAGGAGSFGFKLDGSDYVTFDNIDINGPATLIYGYWLANGTQNCTIKNSSVTVPYGTTTNYGIYAIGIASNPISNLTVLNNVVSSSYSGIYLSNASGSEAPGVNVQGNTVSGVRNYAVYAYYCSNGVIQYNNLGFYSGGTTAYYGIYIYGSTSSFNVHHNTISGGYTTGGVYGIYNYYTSSTIDNNTLSSVYNTSSTAYYAMYDNYGGTTVWSNNQVNTITNTGTASFYGLYGYYGTSSTWYGNTMSGVTITSGTMYASYMNSCTTSSFHNNTITGITGTGTVYGLYITGGTTNSAYANKIYNLNYGGTSTGLMYGIYISSGTTNYTYNNMIYDLRAAGSTGTAPQIRGIAIAGGTTNNLWYNSVYLNATGTGTTFSTAALYISTTSNTIDMKNNIFVNKSTPGATGRATAFWRASATGVAVLSAATDKNIYFTTEPPAANTPMGYFYLTSTTFTTYTTLTEYQVMAAPKDAGSYWEDVPFESSESPYDLHIRAGNPTRVEGNAIVVSRNPGYDFDGEARSASTPDIGADEGDFEAIAGLPGNPTLVSPADDATGLNPNGLIVSWAAPAAGGTPTEYYVFVSPSFADIDDFFGNAVSETVTYPATSLNLDNIAELDLGFSNTWYWAVQAHNATGDTDPYDPAFMVWNFTTTTQMQASNTLNLGNCWPEIEKNGNLQVTNLGTTAITVVPDASPEFRFDLAEYVVPGSSTNYNIPYTFDVPATPGTYSGTITLTQTDPLPGSEIEIAVTGNITTDTTVGTGTAEFPLPVDPYFGYSYTQTIYYPEELGWPSGWRISKLYYYFNGYEVAEVTKSFKIYMSHTTEDVFATTASWLPIAGFTQVYDHDNIPQLVAGGYWMEFVLDTPFIYNGTDNLVIAVEENFASYDSNSSFFFGTATTGINRSIGQRSDTVNADPAAPPTGTLYAAIPNTRFFVEEIPTIPQLTVNPESWDFGNQIINTVQTKEFTVSNTGGGTLSISNITIAGDTPPYTFIDLPTFPLNLGTGASDTFTVQFAPTVAGPFTATVSITDNRSITDVAITGVCVDPRISTLPHTQNFDGVTAPAFPLGWTGFKSNAGMTVTTSTTYAQSTPNSAYMTNSSYTTDILRVISPQILVPMNTIKLNFYARSSSAGYTLKVGTVSALDGTGVFTELGSFPLTATFAQYTVSLATYTGTDQYLCFQHGQASTYQGLYVDNVYLEELLDTDMMAVSLSGPVYGFAETEMTYNLTVKNNGTLPQAAYTVNLKRRGDEMLASLPITTTLDAGATAVHTFNWTPGVADIGPGLFYGEVVVAGDEYAPNDETADKAVTIYPADVYNPVVGDPLTTTTSNLLPTNVYWKNGVTETIYTATEMQMSAGTIQGVAYFNNFTDNVPGRSYKIWVKNTTATDLATAWLDFAGYTLVFDGVLDIPIGQNIVYIPFSTPYAYTGGNFAVRVNRVMDTVYFPSTNVWFYSVPKYGLSRSRYIQSDTTLYDPLDPGLLGAGTLIDNIPVTAWLVTDAVPVVLTEPVVTAVVSGTNVQLDWAAVPGAYAYRIYGSNDPLTWPEEPLAVVWTNTHNYAPTTPMQFFRVEAVSSYRGQTGEINLQPTPVIGDANGNSLRGTVTGYTDNKD